MADPERFAGERMRRGLGGPAVVGEQLLDFHAVTLIERERPAQEPDRGRCFLIWQDLGVGQACGVVDSDVHVVPARDVAVHTSQVASLRFPVAPVAGDPLARAAANAPELLHIDMDQLTSDGAFIALGGLHPETTQATHPDPLEDSRTPADAGRLRTE